MKKRSMGLAIAVVLIGGSAWAQDSLKPKGPEEDGTKPGLAKIAGEGLMDSPAFQWLTELSDDVGARVTGSPAAQKAIDWGLAKMNAIGLSNVHTEQWSMWKGWTRGTASAELVAPIRRVLYIDAMGWSGSTPVGGAEAEIVTANVLNLEAEIKNSARFRGKIVMMKPEGALKKSPRVLFAQYGDFLIELQKAGAIAVIGGQGGFKSEGMHLTHTGSLGFARDFAIPVVDIAAEDQSQIERFMAAGKTVSVRINVQTTFTSGTVFTAQPQSNFGNVVVASNDNEGFFLIGFLETLNVKPGDTVIAGQTKLGDSAPRTGRFSTGPHIHFGMFSSWPPFPMRTPNFSRPCR